ncbi:patatin-like phospholipase family protein [Flavobacterium hydrophilum]|uniref:Alpha/beta hydrolase n=1 Tax=Flavobacterium hydrophilum TaxID=2211445 RepID=A0A2V4C558_9FLAO|nr:patatin-like phospholipase family protein [Flavobacterium hydrophilum]PXY46468.1 alpha/beta hydrolase [Flavobacterium hydrophilum]
MTSLKDSITNTGLDEVKRSLILAGGGARLSYQAGVINALAEEGINFNHFDGTSGGIFNTAMICSHITPKEMAVRWRKVNVMHFSSLLPFKSYFSKKNFNALGDADGIINKIFPALGIDIKKMNANTSIDATFNVCNFSKKTIEALSNQNVTLKHLVAGMSLPIFMPAIKINGDWYTDAVWIKDANINEAIKRNPNEIWLVWAIGNSHEFLNGSFNQYVHMIEISANGGLLLELEQLEMINSKKENEKIVLHVIKPEFPLPLDSDLMFYKINVDELINRGYADAKHYLQNKSEKGVNPDYKASLMKEPGISLNFRSQFSGMINWKLKSIHFSLNISFNFRLIANDLVLRAYGSLSFDNSIHRISTYNNKVTINHHENILIYESSFVFEDEVFHLQCYLDLISQYDVLLGMEFKKAHCAIQNDKFPKPVSFTLKQPAWIRIKNIPFIHINSNNGWLGRQKEKFRILKKIYN